MNALEMPNPLESREAVPPLRKQCLSLLISAQNADGGWGFHAGQSSRVEPACWALCALRGQPQDSSVVVRANRYLQTTQLPDGSWPASSQMKSGSWVTSLACSVLRDSAESRANVKAGLEWLCEDFPRDSSWWRRFLGRLGSGSASNSFGDTHRGWGWTPRTSSWVEPTAFALMTLSEATPQLLPGNALRRRELAISLLYDRMCPGGGWNCGNPRVYGVDGDALVLATCWALLALREAPEKPGRPLSIAWLEKESANIQTAGSLAVAKMTLENYGRELPKRKLSLEDFSAEELAEEGTHVLAWVCMALDPARPWPSFATRKLATAKNSHGSVQ
jgi:hypothetical protein